MQYAAHLRDRPPGETFGRGETPEAAIADASKQFVGAPKYWELTRAWLIATEVADDFRGDHEA